MPYLVLIMRVTLDRLVTRSTPSKTHYTVFYFFQINYLIDESFNIGKGTKTIISMLHHFFEYHAFGETKVNLHADNCTGQIKNCFMIYYLM